MAKIFVSFSSHIFDKKQFRTGCFYEGFIYSLREYGNTVLAMNTADILTKPWNGDNLVHFSVNEDLIIEDIKKYDPDIAIIFNNSIPKRVKASLKCPIFIWGADAIEFFNDKEDLKKNIEKDRYIFFTDNGVKGAVNFGVPKNNVSLVHGATGVHAEPIKQDKNISFIGSNFINSDNFIRLLRENDPAHVKKVANELRLDFFGNHDKVLKKYGALDYKDLVPTSELASLGSSQDRISTLNLLSELGLTIYGDSDWYSIARYLPWLAMSYNPKKIYSLKHNQDIYNASKICISISHSQTLGGMAWRIMDIMASNGCLVSDKRSGVSQFAKEYVNIPTYETPMEAYKQCKRILENENLRKDIVAGSQECIEKKGRWKHRFKEMEDVFGVQLLQNRKTNKNSKNGVYKIISADQYINNSFNLINTITNCFIFIIPRKFYPSCYRIARKIGVNIDYKSTTLVSRGEIKNIYDYFSKFKNKLIVKGQ